MKVKHLSKLHVTESGIILDEIEKEREQAMLYTYRDKCEAMKRRKKHPISVEDRIIQVIGVTAFILMMALLILSL